MTTTRSSSNSKVLEEFQKEIIEEDDSTRLKFIKELDSILGLQGRINGVCTPQKHRPICYKNRC